VAANLRKQAPGLTVSVFSDRDIGPKRAALEEALATADVLFCSLLFDYDQVEWIRERVER
jgi:magnesium chelatase subunit H